MYIFRSSIIYLFWAFVCSIAVGAIAGLGFFIVGSYPSAEYLRDLESAIEFSFWGSVIGSIAALGVGTLTLLVYATIKMLSNRNKDISLNIATYTALAIFCAPYCIWLMRMDPGYRRLLSNQVAGHYMYIFMAIPIVVVISLLLSLKIVTRDSPIIIKGKLHTDV